LTPSFQIDIAFPASWRSAQLKKLLFSFCSFSLYSLGGPLGVLVMVVGLLLELTLAAILLVLLRLVLGLIVLLVLVLEVKAVNPANGLGLVEALEAIGLVAVAVAINEKPFPNGLLLAGAVAGVGAVGAACPGLRDITQVLFSSAYGLVIY
jgi:hypothetical protein